jgi:hypothetical protein
MGTPAPQKLIFVNVVPFGIKRNVSGKTGNIIWRLVNHLFIKIA